MSEGAQRQRKENGLQFTLPVSYHCSDGADETVTRALGKLSRLAE